jgi:hypothetical protein
VTTYRCVPRLKYISDISQSQQAVVELTDDHDFSDGEIVSFRVSQANGMRQLNNKEARVLSHTDTTITVDIDTSDFDAFIDDLEVQNPPIVVPSASGIIPNSNPPTVNLEDAFDNIRVN